MSDIFKTTKLTYDQLLSAYERIGADYQKEAQENAQLKSDIKHYRAEIQRLEDFIRSSKKQESK